MSARDFTQLSLGRGSSLLKIDLVNDVAAHFGAFAGSAIYPKLVVEAREKELGLDASGAAGVLGSFPMEALQRIRWRERPVPESLVADLSRIARDMLAGGENGLALPGAARIE